MNQQADYIAQLIKKLFDGSLSEAEKAELNLWLAADPNRKSFLENLNKDDQLFDEALQWIALDQDDTEAWLTQLSEKTIQSIKQLENPKVEKKAANHWKLYAAAVLILGIALSALFFQHKNQDQKHSTLAIHEIKPGKYQATLHLPDGQSLALSETHNELQLNKDQILSYGNGEILLDLNGLFSAQADLRISVPRAGHYRLKLPDGSLVWLNSESTLRFPISFKQDRVVALAGEAYFNIQALSDNKSVQRGFFVNSQNQTIEVKGTQFNVNTFNKEVLKTTLVEGKVTIRTANQRLALLPNEQSILRPTGIAKSPVDISSEIAWIDNRFSFNATPLPEAMLQLSRWYDLEIEYEKNSPNTLFYGEFSREQPLQEVLKILEESGVKFEFQRRNQKNHLSVLP